MVLTVPPTGTSYSAVTVDPLANTTWLVGLLVVKPIGKFCSTVFGHRIRSRQLFLFNERHFKGIFYINAVLNTTFDFFCLDV
jgi:hypothetical protein